MSYKNFQVPKELYIPITDGDFNLSLSAYKEKYGIDLREYIRLTDENKIAFSWPECTKVYLCGLEYGDSIQNVCRVGMITNITQQAYDSGSDDGTTIIGFIDTNNSFGFGINLVIPKSSTFAIDNITITSVEI